MISIVTPAYNEAANLPLLYQRLCATLESIGLDWEWIVIDDHSTDSTYQVVSELIEKDQRISAWRFARNFGSHMAITCGLQQARGECAAVLASDLQDPPETIPALLEKWRSGAQIVWAKREHREGTTASSQGFSRLYYFLMRHIVGIKQMPATGADFFLLDRQVINAFLQFKESNVSMFALITWMGFNQATITYDKRPRVHGRSGWTFGQKIKLVVDSITSFSYLPVRLMSYLGFFVALLGFLYAVIVIINGLAGRPPTGWASLMVVVLVIGGLQMLMMGVLGEYLWRALVAARQRPRYIIESAMNAASRNTQIIQGS